MEAEHYEKDFVEFNRLLAVALFCKYYNHLGLDEVNRLNQ